MVLLAWWAGRERAVLLETILKFSVCWAAGTWYADVRVVWVDVTDLHRVLHAAALSAVAVHFDEPGPGGGERPASIIRSVWVTLLGNTLRFINYHIIVYIMSNLNLDLYWSSFYKFVDEIASFTVKKRVAIQLFSGREECWDHGECQGGRRTSQEIIRQFYLQHPSGNIISQTLLETLNSCEY